MNVNADGISLRPHYLPIRWFSRIVAALFVAMAALSWTAVGYDSGEVYVFAKIRHGFTIPTEQVLAHAKAGAMLQFCQLVAAALLATTFVPWLYQARCNLRAFGVRLLRFSRDWTWLGFVIPGLNAYRPYQVVSEVWRGSDPDCPDPVAWKRERTPGFVTAWWVTLVGWVSLEALSAQLLHVATGVSRVQVAHLLGLTGDLCAALAASLGYLLVMRVMRGQEAKARRCEVDHTSAPGLEGQVAA